MDLDNLIRMANRIGDFFAALPDAAEAQAGIANHLKRFWEPRMRAEILAHVESGGASGVGPLVAAAIRTHAEALRPAAGTASR